MRDGRLAPPFQTWKLTKATNKERFDTKVEVKGKRERRLTRYDFQPRIRNGRSRENNMGLPLSWGVEVRR